MYRRPSDVNRVARFLAESRPSTFRTLARRRTRLGPEQHRRRRGRNAPHALDAALLDRERTHHGIESDPQPVAAAPAESLLRFLVEPELLDERDISHVPTCWTCAPLRIGCATIGVTTGSSSSAVAGVSLDSPAVIAGHRVSWPSLVIVGAEVGAGTARSRRAILLPLLEGSPTPS